MKKIKNYCLLAVLGGSIFATSFLSNATAQTLGGAECSDCVPNKRRAIVACIRLGGTFENGEPAGWINVGDRFKCKTSQDSQCSGETACTLSQP
jgi:hypothetical protein